MAADIAIFTSSSTGMLQRITVSAPLIVPDRMENGLFIDLFFTLPAFDDHSGRSCSRIIETYEVRRSVQEHVLAGRRLIIGFSIRVVAARLH
jgi:hypothetical protein